MKSKFYLTVLLSVISFVMFAQNNALTNEMIEKMRLDYTKLPNQKALENAISSNNPKDLAINRANLGTVDTYFSNKVSVSGITDQKSSGRCWLFTGLNVLRPIVAEKLNMDEVQFSQNYLFFYDQLEKANLFLEGIISTVSLPMSDRKVEWFFKNPIGDGGQWTGVVELVNKYGLVPTDVMPETYNSENTGIMSDVLATKLREDGLLLRNLSKNGKKEKALQEEKLKMLTEIYQILALSLGQPPKEFTWRYKMKNGNLTEIKTYTPQSFYKEFVAVNLTDYVMFMNDPSRPYYQLYEIEFDRHNAEGGNWKYINLPVEEIKKFAVNSIKANKAMYFSCDVGKQLDSKRGYLDVNNFSYSDLYVLPFKMDKKARIETFESSSSHGMNLVAVDLKADGSINKWLLENSWGMKGYKGYLIMTDEWFSEYMFRIVINKDFVSPDVLKILQQKPVMLPPWDPMFSNEL